MGPPEVDRELVIAEPDFVYKSIVEVERLLQDLCFRPYRNAQGDRHHEWAQRLSVNSSFVYHQHPDLFITGGLQLRKHASQPNPPIPISSISNS